ncbi:MAG: amphi-Trp domain-containing protein [Desulfobacterales bacterium]|jgi:amphi-Trp domain-containing protein|nr:amphi-Trp domain-containing protein [Desulfobacterales bacterium]
MTEDGSFDYESIQDVRTICSFLDSLNQGFESGQIILSSDNETLELSPQMLLKFKISAKKKKDKSRLEMKISWKHLSKESDTANLSIGT